ALDADVAHHVQLDDVPLQLRVDDLLERLQDVFARGFHPRLSLAKMPYVTWPGLVLRNLLRRPVRTALTAAGVSVGVGLIVALLSITNGAKRTAGQLIHIGRADFGLFQAGTADLTQSLLPESMAREGGHEPRVAGTERCFVVAPSKVLGFG